MLALLVWLLVSIALTYELSSHHVWRVGLAAVGLFAWLLWVCGGAAVLSRRRKERAATVKRAGE